MNTTPASPRGRAQRQQAIGRNYRGALSQLSVGNILTTLSNATEDQEAEGLLWYATAYTHAKTLGFKYNLTTNQAAGIIAALSPQTSWTENLRLADALCFDPTTNPGHYDDAYTKAYAIATDGVSDPLTYLGGRKVRSFYYNISNPTRPGPVTIDRHAIDIAAGERGFNNGRHLDRIGYYHTVAALYRQASRLVNVHPHQLQAITWVTHRNPNLDEEF